MVKVRLDVGPINLRQRAGTLVERDFDQSRIRLLSRWEETFAAHLFYFRVPPLTISLSKTDRLPALCNKFLLPLYVFDSTIKLVVRSENRFEITLEIAEPTIFSYIVH